MPEITDFRQRRKRRNRATTATTPPPAPGPQNRKGRNIDTARANAALRKPPVPNPVRDLGWTPETTPTEIAERIETWFDDHARNAQGKIEDPAVVADIPPGARIMIIGEAPAREELRLGLPFKGPAGRLLRTMLAATGLACHGDTPAHLQCILTNATFWFCEPLQPPNADSVLAAGPALAALCAAVRPRHLIGAGHYGARVCIDPAAMPRDKRGGGPKLSALMKREWPANPALTALLPHRAAPPRVWAMWHPAHTCRNEATRPESEALLRRVAEAAQEEENADVLGRTETHAQQAGRTTVATPERPRANNIELTEEPGSEPDPNDTDWTEDWVD